MRIGHRWLSAAPAAVLAAAGLAEIWVPFPSVQGNGSRTLASVVVVIVCAALTLRRSRPLTAEIIALGTWPIVYTFTPLLILFYGQFVPMVVAVYSAARHVARRRVWLAAAIAAVPLVFLDLRVPQLRSVGEVAFDWSVFAVAFGLGRGMHLLQDRAAREAERAADTAAASAERAAAAAENERARIARDLHDLVAHAVSIMVVQAGSAELIALEDPRRAQVALARIRETGVDALAEMRRVVTMLRTDCDPVPAGGVDSVRALVDQSTGGDLTVTLDIAGAPRALPAGLDLAVYRIVQEALTNVRRHANADRAWVRLGYGPDLLSVSVGDNGVGIIGADGHAGHGLAGMRERARLYGGTLTTSSGPGLTVAAEFPL